VVLHPSRAEKSPPCTIHQAAAWIVLALPGWQGSGEEVARDYGFNAGLLRAAVRRAKRDLRRYLKKEKGARGSTRAPIGGHPSYPNECNYP
jgi:hypothetical protein